MVTSFDPYDDSLLRDARPTYDALLAKGPLHYLADYDTWAVLGFGAVRQACIDTDSFTCTTGVAPNQILLGEPSGTTFPQLDPPEHRMRRRVFLPEYTREAAENDEAMIRRVARDVIRPLVDADEGEFDAFADYASLVAIRIAGHKIGLSPEQAVAVRHSIDGMFTRLPGQRGTSAENVATATRAFEILTEVVTAARAEPERATGVLRHMLAAAFDDAPLSDQEIAAELQTLMLTGSETTERSVAATLYYLAQHPEQLARVRADRSLIPWAYAEAIRYDHPTNMLGRRVKRDVEVAGEHLCEGQGVLLVWAAANRDPAVFDEPDRFDLDRRPDRDLLFGHGQHKCLGEHIAMCMGRVMLEEFFDAVDSYEVVHQGVERAYGEFLKGFVRLPIRYRSVPG